MIKVLRIINRFNLGGPSYNATYLTAHLSEEFRTKLIGGRHEKHEGASTFIPEQQGVKFQILEELQREISYSADRRALRKLREIIRAYQPDIVHTHAAKAGFLGRLAASMEGVPVIVHTFHGHIFHSYFGFLKTKLYIWLERYIAKKTDAIIAISKIQKKELDEVYRIAPTEKFEVIPLGFDLHRFRVDYDKRRQLFRRAHGLKKDEIALGIIGRLTAIKNHSFFFAAIEKALRNIDARLRVFVIGDGELMEEVQGQAREIEERWGGTLFIFTSWIKDIETALPGLDILALSSLNEGTPVSLIEAQAAGVPVITTNVGGVKNVVEDGKTGLVIESFDVNAYAKGLTTLINSKEIRQKMSQNGWKHVKDKFHYLRLCKDVETLYKELLNRKGFTK